MIDLHCHPLPFLDDGAPDWDASLAMARMAVRDGVTQWVATPHWTGSQGEVEKAAAAREELARRLDEAGLPLRIHAGNEVILVPDLAEALEEGRALTLAGTNYILLETAQFERGAYIHSALFKLQSHGYRVILAHPERLRAWQTDLQDLRELVFRGCYLQLNAGSLTGDFGGAAVKTAEKLLRLGWYSFLGSDGHSPTHRPPVLSPALAICEKHMGGEAAQALVLGNPARVLCGEHVPLADVESQPKRKSWWPWGR